jgi:alpha-1,3-mannosyltransferase
MDHGARTGAVILCIGAFLDFTAGAIQRAPPIVRRLRAEWLYRLWLEPRRMFGRYIGGAPPFLAAVLREKITGRG